MTLDSQSFAGSTESETLDEVMRQLLPTPMVSHLKATLKPGGTGTVSIDGHGICFQSVRSWRRTGVGMARRILCPDGCPNL